MQTKSSLLVLCQYLFDIIHSQSAVYILIDREYRSKTACTDTAACFEGEFPVSGTFAACNAKYFLKFVVDIARTLYIASRAEAHTDAVFALGIA